MWHLACGNARCQCKLCATVKSGTYEGFRVPKCQYTGTLVGWPSGQDLHARAVAAAAAASEHCPGGPYTSGELLG